MSLTGLLDILRTIYLLRSTQCLPDIKVRKVLTQVSKPLPRLGEEISEVGEVLLTGRGVDNGLN